MSFSKGVRFSNLFLAASNSCGCKILDNFITNTNDLTGKKKLSTSKICSKCVFCFHCISVSSNSIYPFASKTPIILHPEKHWRMTIIYNNNIDLFSINISPPIFQETMFSKVISYCRFCSFQGHVNVIDDQYARDFFYDGPEFIWKYIIITILIRVYLPI